MIFCNECNYMRTAKCAIGCFGTHCKANPIPQHDFAHCWKQEEDCKVKNRNNNCLDFKYKRGIWGRKK